LQTRLTATGVHMHTVWDHTVLLPPGRCCLSFWYKMQNCEQICYCAKHC